MGVRRGGEALGALQRRVDATLEGLGFPLETRPFHGHLTLARVNSMRDTKALIDIVRGQKNLEAGASILERLTLYKSDLGPAGPTYTALRHWPLGAKPADAPSAPQLDA
jgi:2'-5' RNA ligase